MGANSNIEWTDATWNPWHGCKKISDGCKFCYMYRDKARFRQDGRKVYKSAKNTFTMPKRLRGSKRIFTCSWSDFFVPEADKWRADAWQVIRETPQHTYQILTKRPELIAERLPEDWGNGYPNVWLGVSVERKKYLGRIKTLAEIPAICRFISFEPLLENVTTASGTVQLQRGQKHSYPHGLQYDEYLSAIHWFIIGGESGNKYGPHGFRPCELPWIVALVSIAKNHKIPVFVKQLGTYMAEEYRLPDKHGREIPVEWRNTFLQPEVMPREFPTIIDQNYA